MLEVGTRVQIGQRTFVVEKGRAGIVSCNKCDLRNCHDNDDFTYLKHQLGAASCGDLLRVNAYFKEIEDEYFD